MSQKRKMIVPVCLWAIALSGCASTSTNSAYDLMREQQEQQAYVQGQEIERWEKRKPSNQQMALQMLQQTLQQGKYFAALAYADAMQTQFGQDPELLVLKAEALRQTGQLAQAFSLYQSLVQGSVSARAWQGLGLVAGEQQHYEKAAEYFKQAARLEPAEASIQSDLAYASLRAGDISQARLALGKAAELEPENPRILSNMALFLLVSGEPDKARFVMQRAGFSDQVQESVVNMATNVVIELRAIHANNELAKSSQQHATNSMASDSMVVPAVPSVQHLSHTEQALLGHRPLLESLNSEVLSLKDNQ